MRLRAVCWLSLLSGSALLLVSAVGLSAQAQDLEASPEPPSAEEAEAVEVQTRGFTDYDPELKKYAYISSAAVWAWPAGAAKVIYVCWENLGDGSDQLRRVVEQAVAETWQAHSQLQFRGWEACAPNNRGIRIRIAEDGPHTKGLGRFLDGKKDGMVLNFTFASWSPGCARTESQRRSCIYNIAVHEFGHALGYAHEHNRFDKPGDCLKPEQGSDGDILMTPYDPHSTMNYCNTAYVNNGQ